MNILVTGGAGFIGSHTVDRLLEKGYEVRVLDSLEPPVHPQKIKPDYLSSEADFIMADIRDRDSLVKALRGIDIVFHLAAYQDYLPDFSKFASINDGGTALLYEVIVQERLPVRKVLLASSQSVYGEGKYFCNQHLVQYPSPRSLRRLLDSKWDIECPICGDRMEPQLSDESHTNPHNQYAISKLCQELYALNLGKQYDIPTIALRYSITQGPRQSFHNAYSGILRTFTLRLLNNLPPVIYEDGQQLRDYVNVKDVVQANLLAMDTDQADYESINVGGTEVMTVLGYAQLLIDLIGSSSNLDISGQFRFGDTRHIISDTNKLRNLGWEPLTNLRQTAEQYIEWAQCQQGITDYYNSAAQRMKDVGVIRFVDTRQTDLSMGTLQ
ncbi:MAG: SDR family NAD(P)-dependent oxidoreductase [Chloroflexota bacterium]|nr:SDR family NAD(P)-dependent oxidoreductase [Chloroflexota bacterium]